METTLYQQTKNFIYKNKHYIILAVVILFAIILAYYFSSDRIVRNKVKKFEDNYLNQNIVQKDYCHNDIKYNMLCDYYVKSSSFTSTIRTKESNNFSCIHSDVDIIHYPSLPIYTN